MKNPAPQLIKVLFFFFTVSISTSTFSQINSSGLLFDGVDDYVSIPHIPAYNLGTGDFTIEMWIRMHQYQVGLFSFPPAADLFNYNNYSGTGISIIYTYNSTPTYTLLVGTDSYPFNTVGLITDNLCHHLAFVRAGTTVTVYLDGILKGTSTHGAVADVGINTIPINVGGGINSSGRLTGFMHEIRFWGIARSQASIQASMNAMLVGNEPALIGYWKCNDLSGQIINDFSPTNNDGQRGSGPVSDQQDPEFIPGCSNCALPSNTTITAGGPTTYCNGVGVVLSAPAGLNYYWTFNWSPPPLSFNQFQTFNTAGIGFSAIYKCILGNNCGNVLSNNTISVTVLPNPTASITAGGPTNFCGPGSVTLNANTGTGLTYQWRLNGVDISGATANSYTVANVAGNFSCVVTGGGCSITSNSIAVSIPAGAPVASISAGGPTTFCSGSSVSLSVTTGTGLTYQWRKNGANISGATNATYNANATGNFDCNVTNVCGTTTSNAIPVTVNPSPIASITAGGPTQFCQPNTVTLSAQTAAGNSYQWQTNSSNVPGATNSSFVVSSGFNTHTCVVTNSGCSATSNYITVIVNLLPIVSIGAAGSLTICNPGSVQLGSTTTATLSRQWRFNGSAISGATNANYVATAAGNYDCLAMNNCGTTTSNTLVVTSSGTCAGGVQFTSANNNRITANSNPAYNLISNNYAVEAWINASSAQSSTSPTILSIRSTTSNGFTFYLSNGRLTVDNGSLSQSSNSASILDNTCHHVAFSRFGSSISIYLDGNLVMAASTATFPFVNSNHALWIGNDEAASSRSFNGIIHDVRIWNMPRSQSEIQSSMNSFLTGFETGLIGYWKMNEGSGQTIQDNSSVNNNGVFGSTTSAESIDPAFTSSGCMIGCVTQSTITAGGPTTFCSPGSVTLNANTGVGLSYQWRLNNGTIPGATNSSYVATAGGNYNCVVSSTCGSATSNSIAVTINTVPTATISAGGATTFCSPGSVTLSANTGTGLTYQWRSNGMDISGATNSSYVVSTSENYDCVVSNVCGNVASNSIAVVASILPTATIIAGGPVTFCSPGSVSLSEITGIGVTYQWRLNGVNISSATSFSYVASAGGNYDCLITNICGNVQSNSIAVTVNNPPVATITAGGPTTFCSPGSVTLSANTGTGLTYQWRFNGGNISGATSSSYVASIGGIYDCVVSNVCGNTPSNSFFVILNLAPMATITAGGPVTFCSPGSVTLSANTGGGLSHQWRLNGVNISGATSSSHVASTGGNYDCVVSNICGNTPSNSIAVTVNSLPTASITAGGPVTFCSPNSVTLSANTSAGLTHQWRLSGMNISGATTSSYVASSGGNYDCVVSNVCGNVSSNSIAVTVNNLPAATITAGGPVTFCSPGSVTFSANTGTGLTYQWRRNNVNILSATSSSYVASSGGNYECVVSNVCGNVSSNSIAVTVNSLPSATITAGGPTTFCSPGSVTLSANTGAGLTHQWKQNGSNISGATASSYIVNASGNYTCLVSNICGGVTSNSIVVTVNATLATPGSITGPATGVCASVKTYSISAVAGATSYTWSSPAGATVTSGQGTITAGITFTAAFSGGAISVIASNACGNSAAASLSVIGAPAQPGTITGLVSVCHNQNNVTYSVVAVASATSYTWTVPPGTQIKNGQGTRTIKVRFGNSAGNITVTANNGCGSSPLRTLAVAMPCRETENELPENNFDITVYPNPTGMQFTFRVDAPGIEKFDLRIFDLTGRMVESYENLSVKEEFTCGNKLKSGIYIGEVMLGDTKRLFRLIKSE